MIIRNATLNDSAAIAAIYNDAVLNSTAIWNEQTVDAANRAAWIGERQAAGYPVLVAVNGADEAIGYASFGDWRALDGYRHTVEHSVYVHQAHRGEGIGKALLIALIARAREIGKHVMVAGIESGNQASIQLHGARVPRGGAHGAGGRQIWPMAGSDFPAADARRAGGTAGALIPETGR